MFRRAKKKVGGSYESISMKDWFIKIPSEELLKECKEEIRSSDANMGESEELLGIDAHQTLMNINYKWWQEQEEDTDAEYKDMIEYAASEYGFIVAGLILAGKYNQQVCNGGHYQYYDNAFADGVGGCMSEHDFGHPMHCVLIVWMEKLQPRISTFLQNETYKNAFEEVNACMKEFLNIGIDTEETTVDYEYDEEEDEDVKVEYENDEYGQMDISDARKLDERYYKYHERFMEIMEYVAETYLEYGRVENESCQLLAKDNLIK